ncbi:uncharacterized protein A4U43_UnF7280 [Asparagus officinalis]|uniref:Membrane insertase YidC/Oxa/ALB C-terminal domain-containing protein n=1 Tax=Asparagus officinalis TaxID=4686 RepID=A0A1R3L695_ASPOF|nr:mitochondrial inner membrane protein OXA1-like [Asparagus officinalis]ONK55136.1 uncharacterized protein A4U43_UnF7280 [Asparagus officinalis]
MATFGRRSLTSGFTLIARHRLLPSFSHLLPNSLDRDQSQSQPLSPSFASQIRNPRNLGFPLPLGLDPFLRSYSSSSSSGSHGSDEIIKDDADVLIDPAIDTSLLDSVASAVPAADSYLPVAALQHLIDLVHSFTGVNWWASIVLTTILIRTATMPLVLNQIRSTTKLSAMRPEMEELKDQMQNSMDPQTMMENQKKMKAIFKKHGVTPFTPLKGLLIQGPIFISFFLAIQNMVEKVPSFKGGGALWFTDLTIPDPLYALPILTGLTFLATVELNMQEGMEGNPMEGTMKKFSRGMAVLTVPLTATFPQAVFCYWITSNLFSLVYGAVLKRKIVRKFLNLPDITRSSNSAPASSVWGVKNPKP